MKLMGISAINILLGIEVWAGQPGINIWLWRMRNNAERKTLRMFYRHVSEVRQRWACAKKHRLCSVIFSMHFRKCCLVAHCVDGMLNLQFLFIVICTNCGSAVQFYVCLRACIRAMYCSIDLSSAQQSRNIHIACVRALAMQLPPAPTLKQILVLGQARRCTDI